MTSPRVLKFGGTSLASPARVRAAARRVARCRLRGHPIVVVVSAWGRTTDRLLAGARRFGAIRAPSTPTAPSPPAGGQPDLRELDRLLSTGEDRSAALLAVALWREGVPARSLRGGEAGIRAEGPFGHGRIVRVDPAAVRSSLDDDVVPVVSGFQGQRGDGETITLGRGGSDASAVALAAALGAECHIVTDVEAVYDADPRVAPHARPYTVLDHDELLRLAESGAEVVQAAAARLAAAHGVTLRVYHFGAPLDGAGTLVTARGCEARAAGKAAP